MSNINVQYQGFNPSEFTQNFMQDILLRINEEAPQTAHIKATIHRDRGFYKGVIQVQSSAGKFFTVATSSHLTELGHLLVQRMHKQLDKWKTKRSHAARNKAGRLEAIMNFNSTESESIDTMAG